MFKNIKTHLEKFWDRTQLGGLIKYRPKTLKELKELNQLYRKYYVELWNEMPGADDASKEQKCLRVRLLEIEDSCPKISQELVRECFVFNKPASREVLTSDCESLFNMIVSSVDRRLSHAFANKYEQVNSAIVLFCAEFLVWLNQLAGSRCERSILEDVKVRLAFLYAVEEKPVFEDELPSDYQIQTLIFTVREFLETHILARLKWTLESESVREYFKNLTLYSEAYVKYTINALVFLYSDLEHKLAKDFDISTYIEISKNSENSLFQFKDTCLGKFIAFLDDMSSFADPGMSMSGDNLFLLENGSVRNEHIELLLSNKQQKSALVKSGINSIMRNEKSITLLISVFGYLNDFNLFLEAFRHAYRLAGEGGNILLCHHLEQETHNLLAAFTQIVHQTKHCIMQIESSCHQLYGRYAKHSEQAEWRRKYLAFKLTIQDANHELMEAQEQTVAILKRIEMVNSSAYREETEDKIRKFQQVIHKISSRSLNRSFLGQTISGADDVSYRKFQNRSGEGKRSPDDMPSLAAIKPQLFLTSSPNTVSTKTKTDELISKAQHLGL